MKENIIQTKSFNFALKIITLYKNLQKNGEFVLSKQLLRSATSVGANIEEAIGSQSKKDFLAKMSIALKESRETAYWLKLLDQSNLCNLEYDSYIIDINEITKILTSISKTTKENL